jgi:predicted Zn-dependent protease
MTVVSAVARSDRPIRLEDNQRILSREECASIAQRIKRLAATGGETAVRMQSWWAGELRWARNRVSLAGDRRDILIQVIRSIRGARGSVLINQLDDASLAAAVRAAERAARFQLTAPQDFEKSPPPFEYAKTAIWSDATYNQTAPERAAAARALIAPAEAAGMLSAGYLAVRAETVAHEGEDVSVYAASTLAQCSMTVRDPEGRGSGWAGLSSYDLKAVDAQALAKRALEKCLASRNPVALEPGRYTVVLEPQAVHELVSLITQWPTLARPNPEDMGLGPFVAGYDNALDLWRTKLGLKVVDERITISHDPSDPLLGVVPFNELDEPYRPVTWIDHGVLAALADGREAALRKRNENLGYPNSRSYRMSGGETTVEEMIATTKRGLLVTRFSNISLLDENSLLASGLTRDGLWLIENGEVTKAVKNLRFTESPLFVLNSIEQMGVPVPVFSPDAPAIVPPLKAHDFSFTGIVDAI